MVVFRLIIHQGPELWVLHSNKFTDGHWAYSLISKSSTTDYAASLVCQYGPIMGVVRIPREGQQKDTAQKRKDSG